MSEIESLGSNAAASETLACQLDLTNPIDAFVNQFRLAIAADELPTGKQQRQLIEGLQQQDRESACELLSSHMGLIAAVAYGFKNRGIVSKDLLRLGRKGMLEAGLAFNLFGEDDFNDYAVTVMENRLSRALGEEPADSEPDPSGRVHIDRVMNFVTGLKDPEPLNDPRVLLIQTLASQLRTFNRRRAATEIAHLAPSTQLLLSQLHLHPQEIMHRNNLERKDYYRTLRAVQDRLGIPTIPELALYAYEGGVPFDIKDPPPMEELTLRERQVAFRYYKPSRAIAAELGLSKEQVDHTAESLRAKTGLQRRIGILIMAHAHGFEPTKQELKAAEPDEALRGFTPLQAAVLQRMHLPPQTIAKQLGRSSDTINNMTRRLRDIMGLESNEAIVQEMRRRGLKYDIVVPPQPLHELLHREAMEVAHYVTDSNEAVGKARGIDPDRVRSLVSYAMRRTGARTHAELLLVVNEYDTGKRREIDSRTPRQRLAEQLGRETLEGLDMEAYVAKLSPDRRKIMELHYLVDEEKGTSKSWRELKREFGWYNPASMANKAVKQLRAMIAADQEKS